MRSLRDIVEGTLMDASSQNAPLLLRVEEVGHLIGYRTTKVNELIRAGVIPVVVIAGRRRIRRSDLEALVAGLTPVIIDQQQSAKRSDAA